MVSRVPVEVGQVRDVSTSADTRQKVQRLVRIRYIGLDVWIENLDGKRPRSISRERIERCPVVPASGSSPAVVTREHYHALLDQAMDTTKEGESFVPLFVRLCAEAAR